MPTAADEQQGLRRVPRATPGGQYHGTMTPRNTEPNPHLYRLERDLTRAQVIEELSAVPDRLRTIVGSASEAALTKRDDAEWSALRTLCHLRDVALVYSARFRWIVMNNDPFLPNYDEDRWVAEATEQPADVPGLVETIAASRADLVRLLSRIPEECWRRTGRHEVMGSVMLEDYVRHELAHEEGHLVQLQQALLVA